MNGELFEPGAFRALIPSVSPSLISDFLGQSGWTLAERREGLAEYWTEPDSSDGPGDRYTVLLPLDEEMRDFKRRLAELLAELGAHFNDDASQLFQRISRMSWDALIFRTESVDTDDSVSLVYATKMLDVGMEMMRLSALYTFDPHRSSRSRKKSSRVRDYLQEDVRLGHTERGSFIFPILSRVGAGNDSGSTFGRHVMANLAQSLERIHRWSDDATRFRNETPPLDLAIAKQLASVTRAPGFDRLNVSFRWAAILSDPPVSSRVPLVFDTQAIVTAREITRRLQEPQRTRPVDEITRDPVDRPAGSRGWSSHAPRPPALTTRVPEARVSGRVISLGLDDRSTERGESPYFIVLQTAEGDVWVSVTEEEHDFALRARADNESVTAVGAVTDQDGRRTLRGALVRPGHRPSAGRRL
ncbi:hypothetical protein [Streptomyces sp. NBC_00343]|uniref:hypothetical protein n=1 Tax=Streptomyces sp. NBC_00343 TaxID=2975719 RepID=UPI002E2AA4C2|nr:hypothetical protein [Streptomyces sp. NBC_00343]